LSHISIINTNNIPALNSHNTVWSLLILGYAGTDSPSSTWNWQEIKVKSWCPLNAKEISMTQFAYCISGYVSQLEKIK